MPSATFLYPFCRSSCKPSARLPAENGEKNPQRQQYTWTAQDTYQEIHFVQSKRDSFRRVHRSRICAGGEHVPIGSPQGRSHCWKTAPFSLYLPVLKYELTDPRANCFWRLEPRDVPGIHLASPQLEGVGHYTIESHALKNESAHAAVHSGGKKEGEPVSCAARLQSVKSGPASSGNAYARMW